MIQNPSLDRPLVTFALLAYNQDQYIREAVESAFSQSYEPMEILLSDDCSNDRTFEIMQKMAAGYAGPHEVRVRRTERNSGISAHFTEIVKLASGHFIVIAAGDDISLKQRATVSAIPLIDDNSLNFSEVSLHNFEGSAPSAHGEAWRNDAIGGDRSSRFSISDYIEGRAPKLVGAARTIRKSAFLEYPDLDRSCPTEDTPSIIRLLMAGNGVKIADTLLLRRLHSSNLSHTGFTTASKFMAIEEQFRRDISFMFGKHKISPPMKKKLLKWAGAQTAKKSQRVLSSGGATKFRNALKFLSSKDVLFRHKIAMITVLFNRILW